MRPFIRLSLVLLLCLFGLFYLKPMLSAGSSPMAVRVLSYCRGKMDEQATYGGRGYAMQFRVPDESKKWYATELQLNGESYGSFDRNRTFFTVAFMDMDGNVYTETKLPYGDNFSEQPAWVTIKIPTVQLPSEFYVVVDFKPNRDQGVYIGTVKNGGGHSRLVDYEYNFYELEEAIDWCIEVKVRDEFRGRYIKYDPANFKKKADPSATKDDLAKKETSEHVVVEYKLLDEVWGKALVKLFDTALLEYKKTYGLESSSPVKVMAHVDPKAETSSVLLKENGVIEWIIKSRNDLLPISRGGKHRHVFGLCRELGKLLIRENTIRTAYAPEGQDEGFAVFMAAKVILDVGKACGRELWPVPFNYALEEGPRYVSSWMDEVAESPERWYARTLRDVQTKVGEARFASAVRDAFKDKPPGREVMKRFREVLDEPKGQMWVEETFPPQMVNPPLLWLSPKPDFEDPGTLAGLKARRYKSMIFLSYDDNSCENTQVLEEEDHAIYFRPPSGEWIVKDMKVYCIRTGGEKEDKITVKLLGEDLSPLETREIPYQDVDPKKAKWQSFGGFPGRKLSSSFYVAIFTRSQGGEGIKIGLDEGGKKPHSTRIMTGSHIAPVPGKGDWMVRLYLEPVTSMDKQGLDESLKNFRKWLSGRK